MNIDYYRVEQAFMPAVIAINCWALDGMRRLVSAERAMIEIAVEMYRAIPRSALWIVPNGGHGPIFFDAAAHFAQTALAFFRISALG